MADPRDGDGDGIIDEGTPRERPATPKRPTLKQVAIRAAVGRGGRRVEVEPGSEAKIVVEIGPLGGIVRKRFGWHASSVQGDPRTNEIVVNRFARELGIFVPRMELNLNDPIELVMDLITESDDPDNDEDGFTVPAPPLADFDDDTILDAITSDQGRKIALLDIITGNEDRHLYNVLVQVQERELPAEDVIIPIDHSLTFFPRDENGIDPLVLEGKFASEWAFAEFDYLPENEDGSYELKHSFERDDIEEAFAVLLTMKDDLEEWRYRYIRDNLLQLERAL